MGPPGCLLATPSSTRSVVAVATEDGLAPSAYYLRKTEKNDITVGKVKTQNKVVLSSESGAGSG